MGRPALNRRALAVDPLGEEAPGPVEVVAIGAGGDEIEGDAVLGKPFGEPAILAAIVFGRELAAAAPALVADAPVSDAEGFALAAGCTLVGDGCRAGRGVAIFDPLLKFLGRAGADVGRQVGLGPAEPAEANELMSTELIRLGFLAPAAEPPRAAVARADAVAPVVLVGKAATRPADGDRPELSHLLDQAAADAVDDWAPSIPARPRSRRR